MFVSHFGLFKIVVVPTKTKRDREREREKTIKSEVRKRRQNRISHKRQIVGIKCLMVAVV